jgi:tyrosinase
MIRRNFLTDPDAAQKYLEGVKILKDPVRSPWPGQDGLSIYDVFVFWHHQSMMMMTPPSQNDRNAAHSGPAFLPWHRYFLLTLEAFLQQALDDADFRVPYWDWSADQDLPNPETSPVWEMINLGQFIGAAWPVRLSMNPTNNRIQRVNRPLRRSLGAQAALPSRDQVRSVLRAQMAYDVTPFNSSSPAGVRNPVEGWIGPSRVHNNVHVWVGGDMQLSSSPNDPIFFLHHCNVDRIWAAWQATRRDIPYMPDMSAPPSLQFHRIDDSLYSLFNETVTPRDMLDYEPRYRYDTLADLVDLVA